MKTGIVHELGHPIQMARDGYAVNLLDDDAPTSRCELDANDRHELQEKAYQSEAILEGWAQFYVAMVFNGTNQSDGAFHDDDEQDYDLDPGTNNTSAEVALVSLEVGPGVDPDVPVDAEDYFGDWCAPRGGVQTHRATQLDWLRFFWDFMTDEPAVEYSDVLDILDAADPRDWNPTDAGPASGRPYARMVQAAHAHLANDLDWDDHLDNGNGR